MAKTEFKKSELDDDIEKLATKIDEATAKSAKLKAEAKDVQADLAALAREQAEIDRIRRDGNSAYAQVKRDLETGLGGVRNALDVLRNYYGSGAALLQDEVSSGGVMQQPAAPQTHEKSSGAGGSIISILEMVENDMVENLAKVETEEADSVDQYEKFCQENKVAKASMEQDVKYKTMEFTSLDKSLGELGADSDSTKAELASVTQYYDEIKGRCIAKPESYEDRAAKRQAEIDGLKQALSTLESEAAFVQKRRRGHMRGALAAQ